MLKDLAKLLQLLDKVNNGQFKTITRNVLNINDGEFKENKEGIYFCNLDKNHINVLNEVRFVGNDLYLNQLIHLPENALSKLEYVGIGLYLNSLEKLPENALSNLKRVGYDLDLRSLESLSDNALFNLEYVGGVIYLPEGLKTNNQHIKKFTIEPIC